MSISGEARILVVESRADLGGELAARLGARGYNVVVTDHGAAVRRMFEVFRPDIAVIEALDDHPEDTVAMLRSLGSARVVMTMAASAPPEQRARSIRAGADDVIVRPFDVDELIVRIDAIVQRFHHDTILEFDDITVDEIGHLVHRNNAELDLTVREFNLLATFVRNSGRVISKRQLLASVWGFDDYDVNLVEVHVSALRKKLEAHGPRIIQTVRGIGYVLRTSSESINRRAAVDLLAS